MLHEARLCCLLVPWGVGSGACGQAVSSDNCVKPASVITPLGAHARSTTQRTQLQPTNVGIMSGPCQDRVRTVSGPCQDRVRTMSGPCQDRVRTVSGPCQHHVRTMSEPCQDRVRTVSGPCQDRARTVSGSCQGYVGANLRGRGLQGIPKLNHIICLVGQPVGVIISRVERFVALWSE